MPTIDDLTSVREADPPARPAPHAEFMQIWEEGYVSNHISFENMQIPGLMIIEGGPLRQEDGRLDRIKVLAYLEATVASDPAFRLRLQRSALGLTPPAWVPDEDFDLSRHVLFADAPVDLATADLRALSGDEDGLMSLRHPLWRMRLTELTDGNIALGTVLHHASLDGMSGMRAMSSMNTKTADEALPAPRDPFAGVHAPGAWALPMLALRQWWTDLDGPKPAAAWRSYWSKPIVRRARRVAARCLLPLRYHRGGEAARAAALPKRHSAYRRIDAAQTGRRARELGGTLSDLLISGIIGAWDGPQREVRLRFPVSFHATSTTKARNNVRDMLISGDADAPIEETMRSVHAQVADRATAWDGREVPGYPIGYGTLLSWVQRPRYFCGGEVLAIVPFPASLGRDQFAAAAIMYNGGLFVGANMPLEHDVEATTGRLVELMSGLPDAGRR